MIFYHEANDGQSRPAALLIHGLTGAPEEMHPLAELLFARGFDVSVPLLTGHDTDIETLCRVPAESWLSDAQRALIELEKRKPSSLLCVGLSFGALLGLYLATRSSETIRGLVLLAPPLEINPPWKDAALRLLSFLPDETLDRLGIVRKRERSAELFTHPRKSYAAHSIGALARSKWILRSIRKDLARIRCPVLIMQDPHDHHLTERSVRILQGLLSSADTTQKWIDGGEHELTIGPRSVEVNEMIAEFLERI